MLNEGNALIAMGFDYIWAFKARPRFRKRTCSEKIADSGAVPRARLEPLTQGDISRNLPPFLIY
jgi:hypothetical protein